MGLGLVTSMLLAFSGMLGLCFGLERHYKQTWQHVPTALVRRTLRTLGWLALLASFAVCMMLWGWAMGPVGWLGLISVLGLAWVFVLPYAGRYSVLLLGIGWSLLGGWALL